MRKRRRESVAPTTVPKREVKAEAKTSKQEYKVDLTLAKAEKAQATANKRKWLVILIGLVLAGYGLLRGLLDGRIVRLGEPPQRGACRIAAYHAQRMDHRHLHLGVVIVKDADEVRYRILGSLLAGGVNRFIAHPWLVAAQLIDDARQPHRVA